MKPTFAQKYPFWLSPATMRALLAESRRRIAERRAAKVNPDPRTV